MRNEEISLNTKQELSAALKWTMEKKPLSKITVSELVRTCDINRNTFYYHFNDIYDLLKWTFEQEAIEVVKKINLLVDTEEAIRHGKRTFFTLNYPLVHLPDFLWICVYSLFKIVQQTNLVS